MADELIDPADAPRETYRLDIFQYQVVAAGLQLLKLELAAHPAWRPGSRNDIVEHLREPFSVPVGADGARRIERGPVTRQDIDNLLEYLNDPEGVDPAGAYPDN